MNLYEFSQVNNQEMGIYITKADDPQLYDDIYNEARRLIRISEEIRVSVEKVVSSSDKLTDKEKKSADGEKGFCIRCKKEVVLNSAAPYCGQCYKVWKKYENPIYQEKYCHNCGKENTSTLNKPVCYDCYKQYKEKIAP